MKRVGEECKTLEEETVKKRIFITLLIFVCSIAGGAHLTPAFGSDSKRFPFPEMIGWKQSGENQTFPPDNLYEYIDGGADLYLNYDFENLDVLEYQNDRKATVTVEVYRHKTSYDAFGVYSQERPPAPELLAVGAQGYRGEDFLNFVTGTYYVKISVYKAEAEGREILISFAKKVEENLGEKGQLPSILKSFPAEGKVRNSEKFIAKKFLGYPFLQRVFTADYGLSGEKFQVFIIVGGDKNESRTMMEKYLRQTGKPVNTMAEGRFTLSDPHHGVVDLLWKGGRIWGILSLDDPALRSKYLKLIEEGLQER